MRFITYAPPLPPPRAATSMPCAALPGVAAWIAGALAETEFVAADEPYAHRDS